MRFLNVRGPNGSGKTTLLRDLARSPEARTVPVFQPVWTVPKGESSHGIREMSHKIGKPKGKPIVATVLPNGVALLGDYTRAAAGATTAGCDRISRQDDVKAALLATANLPGVELTIFEGIIVSTIFGPWLEWERVNGGMWWAFLDTPLEVCLERIQQRNGGTAIKSEQVADKHKTIREVRRKVLNAYPGGGRVIEIRWQTALRDMKETVAHCLDFIRSGASLLERSEELPPAPPQAEPQPEPPAPREPAPRAPCCPDEERNASGMCVYCGDPGK